MYVSWPVQYMLNDVLRNPRGHKKVYSVCECPVCALKRGGGVSECYTRDKRYPQSKTGSCRHKLRLHVTSAFDFSTMKPTVCLREDRTQQNDPRDPIKRRKLCNAAKNLQGDK